MASNKEVEIKFRIDGMRGLTRKLRESKFRLVTRRTHEMNTIYDLPGEPLRERGELLRLRKYGVEWVLTHKAKGSAGHHKTRVETESKADDDGSVAEALFDPKKPCLQARCRGESGSNGRGRLFLTSSTRRSRRSTSCTFFRSRTGKDRYARSWRIRAQPAGRAVGRQRLPCAPLP